MAKPEAGAGLSEFEGGLRLLYDKQYAAAQRVFETVGASKLRNVAVSARARQYAEACNAKTRAGRDLPQSFEEWTTIAVFHINQHHGDSIKRALDALSRARKLDQESDLVSYLEAVAHCRSGKQDEALRSLSAAVEKDPVNKVRALNDPDFDSLKSTDAFSLIVRR